MTNILYSLSEDIATITLNRPQVMNALSRSLRKELLEAIKTAESSARVLVLTGAGRGFCSGQDLHDAAAMGDLDLERILNEEYVPLLMALNTCAIPTISAVNGAAVGAGAGLALAADVVIATQSASFSQSFANIGLVPDAGGSYWLPRQIGTARSMGAMLFAEKISADDAARWGMIWESIPDAEFLDHVKARATYLAKGPTTAFRGIKTAVRSSFENTLDQQLVLESKLQGMCNKTEDFREGMAAFLQKRRPNFVGH